MLCPPLFLGNSLPQTSRWPGPPRPGRLCPPESIPRSPVNLLEPARAGPFIAKVQPVNFDTALPTQFLEGDLGFMNPAGFQRKPTRHVPVVPLSWAVRALVQDVQASAVTHEASGRDPMVPELAPFRPGDENVFATPKCP